ncbi:hypothetical protein Goklo_008742 [Gossypium klotzschianum]|uniref:Uncharacterized protein n=1 Tax=Gossypium klotzschianum TaxID=34286 RepID=A0A7J8V0S4_9ROSI|nr:hypothetical protein [Gossypium klotzschianum]
MVRADRGASTEDLSSAVLMFWAVLAALSLVTAIIFSCAGGASKEKASATHADTYGSTCAAGCGAGCGAGCEGPKQARSHDEERWDDVKTFETAKQRQRHDDANGDVAKWRSVAHIY